MDTFAVDLLPLVSTPPPPRKPLPRLAIVSTTNKLCGIGAYTAALRRQLDAVFEVTILDLDQYLLRGRHPRLKRQADRHVRQICDALGGFDAVNLQLEHGTLGYAVKDIYRRFCWLVEAAPSLSVTFHTLHPPTPLRLTLWTALRNLAEYRRNRMLSLKFARRLRRAQRRKPVAAIAHNQHDHREIHHLYGIETVFDHPLSFLSDAEAAAIRSRAAGGTIPALGRIPAGARLIGVFGFLNDYKGLGTAIRALRHLPDDHHLLIFGREARRRAVCGVS